MSDDVARFFARIMEASGGEVRAECWIASGAPGRREAGSETTRSFRTREDARRWIHDEAGARGFEHWTLVGDE